MAFKAFDFLLATMVAERNGRLPRRRAMQLALLPAVADLSLPVGVIITDIMARREAPATAAPAGAAATPTPQPGSGGLGGRGSVGVWSAWAQGFLKKKVKEVEVDLAKEGYSVTISPEVPDYLRGIPCDFESVTRVDSPGADAITLYYDPRAKIPAFSGAGLTVKSAREKLVECGFRNIQTGAQDDHSLTNTVPAGGTCWRVTDPVTINGDPQPQVTQAGK